MVVSNQLEKWCQHCITYARNHGIHAVVQLTMMDHCTSPFHADQVITKAVVARRKAVMLRGYAGKFTGLAVNKVQEMVRDGIDRRKRHELW